MTAFKLTVHEHLWPYLTFDELRAKLTGLMTYGIAMFEAEAVPSPPPKPIEPPKPEIRIEKVEVFVCPWVKCHKKFHTRKSLIAHYARVHKVTGIELKP